MAWLDIFHLTDVFDVVLVSHPLPPLTQLRWYLKTESNHLLDVHVNLTLWLQEAHNKNVMDIIEQSLDVSPI